MISDHSREQVKFLRNDCGNSCEIVVMIGDMLICDWPRRMIFTNDFVLASVVVSVPQRYKWTLLYRDRKAGFDAVKKARLIERQDQGAL